MIKILFKIKINMIKIFKDDQVLVVKRYVCSLDLNTLDIINLNPRISMIILYPLI